MTNAAFINADGTYNVAAIMAVAHRHARHNRNRTICWSANVNVRGSIGTAEADYAAAASQIDARTLTILPRFSYAAELAKALKDCWFQARVLRSRHVPAPVVIAEPVAVPFLLAA